MKCVLRLILLLGALLGIFGQQMAYAGGPGMVHIASSHETMTGCDMAMSHRENGKPRKDMSLDCIAAMGCTIPFVEAQAPVTHVPAERIALAPASATTRVLVGFRLSPEPEPPTV